jgi:hypothetical protein
MSGIGAFRETNRPSSLTYIKFVYNQLLRLACLTGEQYFVIYSRQLKQIAQRQILLSKTNMRHSAASKTVENQI